MIHSICSGSDYSSFYRECATIRSVHRVDSNRSIQELQKLTTVNDRTLVLGYSYDMIFRVEGIMFKGDRIFRIYCALSAVVLCFWWPLSHWLYSDLYHSLMGFSPGGYQASMVKMIGTCGVLPVMMLGYLAFAKERPAKLVTIMSVFSLLIGATFFHLIQSGQFPKREYINVGLCLFTAIVLQGLARRVRIPESVKD